MQCRGFKDIKYDIPVCHEGHEDTSTSAFLCILHFILYGAYRRPMNAIFMNHHNHDYNKDERQPCPHGAHFKPDINRRNRQEAGTTRPSEDYWYYFRWMSWCTGVFSALKWSGAYRGGGACHPGHKVCLFVDQLKMVGIWETDSWQRKEQKRQRW